MKVAYICSNNVPIKATTTKGTEIFNYTLLHGLARYTSQDDVQVTVFASGNSEVPQTVISVDTAHSNSYAHIQEWNKHIIFELSLLSKAFSMQNEFDLYHINIGDGDIALPFAPFVNKPILITLHHLINEDFTRQHFALYKQVPNIHFVSASEAQRTIVPDLHYAATIPHGTDVNTHYQFDAAGGNSLFWAGRLIPEKGVLDILEVATRVQKPVNLFGIYKPEQHQFHETVQHMLTDNKYRQLVSLTMGKSRLELIPYLQKSKAFMFPIQADEAFGLVLIEAMACGTPIIAYARGSVPEIVIDGETGFLVDPDAGVVGLAAAVKRLYSLSNKDYASMRRQCRERVLEHYSTEKMVQAYIDLYTRLRTGQSR